MVLKCVIYSVLQNIYCVPKSEIKDKNWYVLAQNLHCRTQLQYNSIRGLIGTNGEPGCDSIHNLDLKKTSTIIGHTSKTSQSSLNRPQHSVMCDKNDKLEVGERDVRGGEH